MTTLELLVCLLQQAEQAGVSVEVSPLRAAGPAGPYRDFAEVVRYLRERSQPNEVDRLLAKMKERGSHWCALGGIDWQRLSKTDWAFTIHEQHLVSDFLGGQVTLSTTPPTTGRLEGVMPGRCFVTTDPTEPKGNAVTRFLQRTDRALPYCSRIVSGPAPIDAKPECSPSTNVEPERATNGARLPNANDDARLPRDAPESSSEIRGAYLTAFPTKPDREPTQINTEEMLCNTQTLTR